MKTASARILTGKHLRTKKQYRQAYDGYDYLLQRITAPDIDSCWEWQKGVDKNGYGQCHSARCAKQNKITRAHQLAYILWKGPILSNMCVCHSCDNPRCCNPKHLFLGTVNDNNQDKTKKGRNVVGNKPSVDYEEVYKYKGKLSSEETAKIFGISFSRVCQIWRKEVDFSSKPKAKRKDVTETSEAEDSDSVSTTLFR